MGNVRFRRPTWAGFELESWGVDSDAPSAALPTVVGDGAEQAIDGVEAGSSAARGECRPRA